MNKPRDQRINVRVTEHDLQRLILAAGADKRSVADFCRVAAIEKAERMEQKND